MNGSSSCSRHNNAKTEMYHNLMDSRIDGVEDGAPFFSLTNHFQRNHLPRSGPGGPLTVTHSITLPAPVVFNISLRTMDSALRLFSWPCFSRINELWMAHSWTTQVGLARWDLVTLVGLASLG